MRHLGETASPVLAVTPTANGAYSTAPALPPRSDWGTLQRLFPYLWQYKWRVIAALSFMVGAKLANVGVPLLLKQLVDTMSFKPGSANATATALLVVPFGLLVAYG